MGAAAVGQMSHTQSAVCLGAAAVIGMVGWQVDCLEREEKEEEEGEREDGFSVRRMVCWADILLWKLYYGSEGEIQLLDHVRRNNNLEII